jgi:uncharacterized SAM-binding protein YcdF (DUF218 family)
LLVVSAGVALLYAGPTLARWARRGLVAVVVAYWILTCPAGAALLARTLTADFRPLETADDASGARAVVLLSGGSRTIRSAGGRLPIVTSPSALRALETARVYRLLGDPLVIVSGGVTDSEAKALSEAEAIRGAVIALGVPTDRVIIESESRNTREEAVILKRLLAERGIDRFVIVTSPIHMGRSLAAFAVEGMHPVPSASPLYQDRTNAPFPLTPNEMSLEIGNAVVYEWCARAYYWWRGWV